MLCGAMRCVAAPCDAAVRAFVTATQTLPMWTLPAYSICKRLITALAPQRTWARRFRCEQSS